MSTPQPSTAPPDGGASELIRILDAYLADLHVGYLSAFGFQKIAAYSQLEFATPDLDGDGVGDLLLRSRKLLSSARRYPARTASCCGPSPSLPPFPSTSERNCPLR
jgi:hypothetical protein